MDQSTKATLVGILGNSFLFILKITAGIISNSIAVISDAINSLTDIASSTAVYICVRLGKQPPDKEHPFGHHRAEPIAGLIIAIFAGILGFEIINISIQRILKGEILSFSSVAITALLITVIIKLAMSSYFQSVGKKLNSPAIWANAIDSKNDIFASLAALVGVVGYHLGYKFLDPVVAVLIGFYVIYQGYKIGKKNIDYLIGRSPDKKFVRQIKKKALTVKGVKGLNEVKAHYVGNYIHVEVHIEVDKKLSTSKAHKIGKNVEFAVESLESINKSFVHIDPV